MRKQFVIFLITILLLLASTTSGENRTKTMIIKSIGGEKALSSLRAMTSYRTSGSIEINGMPGEYVVQFKAPDKIHTKISLSGYKLTQAFDGVNTWMRDMNNQVSELTGMERKSILKNLFFDSYRFVLNDSLEHFTRSVYDTTIHSQTFKVIPFIVKQDTVKYLIDPETNNQVMRISSMEHITSITTYGDIKSYNNILYPTEATLLIPQAQTTIATVTDTIEFNVDIPSEQFQYPGVASNSTSFPLPTSITMPFTFHNGHIYINATLGGKKLLLLLDSGASTNLFHLPNVSGIALDTIGRLPAMGISGFEQMALLRFDTLQIGDLPLINFVGGGMDMSNLFPARTKDPSFGGILGYDFLSLFPIELDFENMELTILHPDSLTLDSESVIIPFDYTLKIPTIDVLINDIPARCLLDLGNPFGLIINYRFNTSSGLDTTLLNIQYNQALLGGVGGQLGGRNALVESLVIGGVHLEDIRVLLPDSSAGMTGFKDLAGNIGTLILRQFRVILDYQNQSLILYSYD